MAEHEFNAWTCARHVSGCSRPSDEEWECNPYYCGECDDPEHSGYEPREEASHPER